MAAGNLPNVSFIDPAFDTAGNGTSADDHPLADIRLGERFIADAYHALAGYLDNSVLVVTFGEWGGFFDHVPPPRVIDATNPADVRGRMCRAMRSRQQPGTRTGNWRGGGLQLRQCPVGLATACAIRRRTRQLAAGCQIRMADGVRHVRAGQPVPEGPPRVRTGIN